MFSLFKKDSANELPPLLLYNTLSRQKEEFIPRKTNEVTLYSCGPTVYDYVHIGNLRAYIMVDILKRTLTYNGYVVNHTLNYTDFGHLTSDADTGEDKMMKGLKREGLDVSQESMNKLAEKYIKAFETDTAKLRITSPTQTARASHYVKEQIKLIETLEEKGYTYTTSDGVYFDVTKYKKYGQLGNIDIEAQQAGARVEVNPEKRHAADFALWKNGELGWDSKWGAGFPGWHIECSAMAFATLGKQIDIHTGGIDHIAVHHNAEIAQCECASGKEFVNYWMHNNFLNVNEEKISKSAGTSLTLNTVIEAGYSPDDFRYFLLQTHYRSPVNFTYEALSAAQSGLKHLKGLMYREWAEVKEEPAPQQLNTIVGFMNDDLNTPQAIAELHKISKDDSLTAGQKKGLFLEADRLLAIGLSDDPATGLKGLGEVSLTDLPEEIQSLVEARTTARTSKDWTEADRLRDELKTHGYEVKDEATGPVIKKI